MGAKKKQTLSVCLIVKNEEQYLPDCLESVRTIADQVVVVDTGSTDSTIAIAKQFGAEVYSFAWCDDFSAARNESIKHAKSDWILWLDADERLSIDSNSELQRLLKPEKGPVAYEIQIDSCVNGASHLSTAHRLFKNHCGISFEGRIHEQISYSLYRLNGEERKCSVLLHHLGYDNAYVEQSKKAERNLKLLKQMIKDDPKNAYGHYTLGQQYGLLGNHQMAMKHFNHAMRLNVFAKSMRISLLNAMAESQMELKKYAEAEKLCLQSFKLLSGQVGAYLIYYRLALRTGKLDLALQRLKQLEAQNQMQSPERKQISTDVKIPRQNILLEFVELYQQLNRGDEAAEILERLFNEDSQNQKVLAKLINCRIQEDNLASATDLIEGLLELNPNHELCQDLPGVLFIKQQRFQKAIQFYQSRLNLEPGNAVVLRRLAGLYAKVGRTEEAQQLAESLT